jgi:hypothetical protein
MAPTGAAVHEVDVVAVAGSPDPGKAPVLPLLVGTAIGVPGFGGALRTETGTYALLRFPVAAGGPATVPVTPVPLGALRFGQPFASVDVLPPGR